MSWKKFSRTTGCNVGVLNMCVYVCGFAFVTVERNLYVYIYIYNAILLWLWQPTKR